MPATLTLISGRHAGIDAPLLDGYYMIGRHSECQIRPRTHKVSRRHCLLHHSPNLLRVYDLGSTNGTFVNQKRLQPNEWLVLSDGDQLRCGGMVFRISLQPDSVPPIDQQDVAQRASGKSPSGTFSIEHRPMEDFDIVEFLEEEDRRASLEESASPRPRVWSPEGDDEDANVLHDDFPDESECPSGINTGIDALDGDADAHAVLDGLRSGQGLGELDQSLSPRARRIAEIRARIEAQRKQLEQSSKHGFKKKEVVKQSDNQTSTAQLISVCLLVCLALGAMMYSVYDMQSSTPDRVSEELD